MPVARAVAGLYTRVRGAGGMQRGRGRKREARFGHGRGYAREGVGREGELELECHEIRTERGSSAAKTQQPGARKAAEAQRSEDGDARKSQGLQFRQWHDHVAMKARWAAGDSDACHSDSTRSNWPSLALRARWAVAGQPRKQAATESDVECGVRELSLSSFFYLLLSKPIS
jgi:hypothetical protein